MEEEEVEFVFNEEELLTVKIPDEPDGWIIEPLAKPCTVSHSNIINHVSKCVLYLLA